MKTLKIDMKALKIDPELRDLIPPLDKKEFQILEESCLNEGIREPIILWKERKLIIDGHNRYQISQTHNLPFKVSYKSFKNKALVKEWMEDNQLGRRNLTDDQRRILIGKRYLREKKRQGKTSPENLTTAESISIDSNVSPSSVRRFARDAKFYEDLKSKDPKTARQVWEGKTSLKDIKAHHKAPTLTQEDPPTKTHIPYDSTLSLDKHTIRILPIDSPRFPKDPLIIQESQLLISVITPPFDTNIKIQGSFFILFPMALLTEIQTPSYAHSISVFPDPREPLLAIHNLPDFPKVIPGKPVKFNPFPIEDPYPIPNHLIKRVLDHTKPKEVVCPNITPGQLILTAHSEGIKVSGTTPNPMYAELILFRLRELDDTIEVESDIA